MPALAAQSVAAALAAFIAVVPLAVDKEQPPEGRRPVDGVRRAGVAALPRVGMPDTGPGTIPLKPLSVVVTVDGGTVSPSIRREVAELGDWLGTHHGRARMAIVTARGATPLVDPAASATTPLVAGTTPAPKLTRALLRGTPGQRLIVAVTQRRPSRPRGGALLWLPPRKAAPVADHIPLREHDVVRQPVDLRRRGVVAATAARGVISVADLREMPTGAAR